jgi:hypothetical protein
MITADAIRRCAYLSTSQLEDVLRKTYPKDKILLSTFLGVTNGGQFTYDCTYFDDIEGENQRCKVFVYIDSTNTIVADY